MSKTWMRHVDTSHLDSPEKEEKMRTFDSGEKYHGHPRFYELLQQMADLHSRKNHDYAGNDPLSNLKSIEEIGIPAWKGILIRLMDKWARLKTFAKKETLKVKDESVIDTLMDNAVYSLLCIIILEESNDPESVEERTLYMKYGHPGDP